MLKNPLYRLLEAKADSQDRGLVSVCSGHFLVIKTAIEQAKRSGQPIIIEATANQVNQYGGYTGLTPAAFAERVYAIADRCEFDRQSLILGGDHLGPMVWKNEPTAQAMEKAGELIALFVEAGFSKIHLDTSMYLLDDDADGKLPTELVAERTAMLARIAKDTWAACADQDSRIKPVFVIGSEVPVAGGSTENEQISLTRPDYIDDMIRCFEDAFNHHGLQDIWQQVVVMVVQPGVEFSPQAIIDYDPVQAALLSDKMKACRNYLFECHSTDYQTQNALCRLVNDGLNILKVGPALTFALREALFGLSMIEDALVSAGMLQQPSAQFIQRLDQAMLAKPSYWQGHHQGSDAEVRLARLFSYADRCRYYLQEPEVEKALDQLISNLSGCEIPLSLVSQFLPGQYEKIRNRQLGLHPAAILKDSIAVVLRQYFSATDGKSH